MRQRSLSSQYASLRQPIQEARRFPISRGAYPSEARHTAYA